LIVAGVSAIGGDYGEQRRIAREPNSVIRSAISTMCVPRRQRRIEPRPRRALEIELINGSKEDTVVPGITDTECRIKQLRYRELHVEAERQRLAATACAQKDRGGVTETLQSRIAMLMERRRHFLHRLRSADARDHAIASGTLAVSK
jgi:hypothetical protein